MRYCTRLGVVYPSGYSGGVRYQSILGPGLVYDITLAALIESMFDEMFTDVLSIAGLVATDSIMVKIIDTSAGLVASIKMTKVDEFDVTDVLDLVEKATTSSETFDLALCIFEWVYSKTMGGGNYFKLAIDDEEFISKKKCIVRIINENDNMCFYHCLALGLDKETYTNYKKHPKARKKKAMELFVSTQRESPIVKLEEIETIARHFNCNIGVVGIDSREFIQKALVGGSVMIYMLFVPGNSGIGHYHYIVDTHIGSIWCKTNFCHDCMCAFVGKFHSCIKVCKGCLQPTCSGKDHYFNEYPHRCKECNLYIWDMHNCSTSHAEICGKAFKCKTCDMYLKKYQRKDHRCYSIKCRRCKEYFHYESEHKCYVQKMDIDDKDPDDKKICYYDYETYLENGTHTVVLIVALYGTSSEPFIFWDHDEFIKWVFHERHKHFTFIAHNAGKYDFHFIKKEMIDRHIVSNDVCNGRNIYYSDAQEWKIKFIDSVRFIPVALREFSKTFGLTELKKGYFPYKLLTKDTLDMKVSALPSIELYDFNSMKTSEYDAAMKWYNDHRLDEFDMKQNLLDYCISDVVLLKEGFNVYRKIFLDITNNAIDPLDSLTIASLCMRIYRTLDMPENTIGVLEDQDVLVEFYNWIYHEFKDCTLRTVRGAVQVLQNDQWNSVEFCDVKRVAIVGCVAYIYQDCKDTGCSKCFNHYTVNSCKMKTMSQLATEARELVGSFGVSRHIKLMQSHTWMQIKKADKLQDHQLSPLRMREAFFGGRTEPTKLYAKGEISYVDFTSLYPSAQSCRHYGVTEDTCDTLTETKYPVGHPKRIDVTIDEFLNKKHLGFIKCSIDVPKEYHCVLPIRKDGKLIFAAGLLVGTWTTIEVLQAVKYGATIKEIFDLVHFEESSSDLFTGYISKFMKLKIEAGGWGKTGLINESDEIKSEYLVKCREIWNIDIDPANMNAYNAGLYFIAKLCCNSLWGKFGQRKNFTNLVDTFDTSTFAKYVHCDTREVTNVFLHSNTARTISFREVQFEDISNTNIAIAAYTTAFARLRLFDLLKFLGDRVIYYDTDSVVFYSTPTIMCGPFLGDLTNELDDGEYISEFISTGPKSYSYRTSKGKNVTKLKGFTLSKSNSQKIDFDSMKTLFESKSEIMTEHMQFLIGEDHVIKTKEDSRKRYKFTFDKREIDWPKRAKYDVIETSPFYLDMTK